MNGFFSDLLQLMDGYYESVVALVPRLIVGILVFLIFLFFANRSRRFWQKRLESYIEDPLLATFLTQVIRSVFIILGLVICLGVFGLSKAASGLLAGAGLSAFIIGFAFKDIVEHFLAGILMAFKRPFRIGDEVELGNVQGKIIGLSIRDTQVKTKDGKDVYIPNGIILKNPIVNYTIDGFLRDSFSLAVDKNVEWSITQKNILQSLKEVQGVLQGNKGPAIYIDNITEHILQIQITYWVNTFDYSRTNEDIKTQAFLVVSEALKEADVQV